MPRFCFVTKSAVNCIVQYPKKWGERNKRLDIKQNLFCFFFAEGFVGDIALPNVRYELEYELQSRRDKELASKTGQVLIDWEIDGDQAEAEKEADRPTAFINGSSTLQPHRLHHSAQLQSDETSNDGQQARPGGRQRQGRKQASITE